MKRDANLEPGLNSVRKSIWMKNTFQKAVCLLVLVSAQIFALKAFLVRVMGCFGTLDLYFDKEIVGSTFKHGLKSPYALKESEEAPDTEL